nr:hypothetical protein [Tanacetum cinerariifolium]
KERSQDKGKATIIEEPVKTKKKHQIRLDEEVAKRLQAEFDEEERLARERAQKKEANVALIETWDDNRVGARKRKESRRRVDTREYKEVKGEDDKETAKLKQLIEIITDKEEVAINAIPLAVKSLSKKLKCLDREDLVDLQKLVKAKAKSNKEVEDLYLLLWGDFKTMFEPHLEDEVWMRQQGYKVLEWKLYDSCGVHSLKMQSMHVYMLVEKTYPFTTPTLTMMLEKKLQIDYQSKMAYQLLKLVKKQLKK